MHIILKNRKPNSLITIIDRRTHRTHDLMFNETCTLFVESEEEIKDYRNCYEAFGVDISIKQPESDEFVNAPVAEEPKPEATDKPKRARRKAAGVETVPVENVTVKEVGTEEAPAEEVKVEAEPVAEEPKAEEPKEEEKAEEIKED